MIVRLFLAILALAMPVAISAAPASAKSDHCRVIGGLESLWSRPSLRWIIVGEVHGTAEMPAAFRDIVCNAAAAKRPIVVAVERSETEQADIDAFMRSGREAKARTALLKGYMWQNKAMQDGRNSRAYLQLLEDLRVMHRGGVIGRVVAFQPAVRTHDAASYEAEMAKRLQSASPDEKTLVLAFVGNCHAMRIPMCGSKSAAGDLPRAETFTIDVEGSGGSVWNCGPDCGVHKVYGPSPIGSPRLDVIEDPRAPYDAMLFLGGPVTASLPAAGQVEVTP